MLDDPIRDEDDPDEQAFRRDFVQLCRDGTIDYERVIEAVYRRASQNWSAGFVIDGGAHAGRHTLPLATLETVRQVVAFEPGEGVLEVLQRRLRSFADRGKIDVIKAALQEDPNRKTITFHISPNHPGRNGINPILKGRKGTEFDAPIDVAATTIDETCLTRAGGCRFIKLDLEGGEYNALRGGSVLLARDKPLIVFENGIRAPEIGGYTREAFLSMLDDAGLVLVTALSDLGTPETMRNFWYAWACPKEDIQQVRALIRAESRRLLEDYRQTSTADL